MRDKYSEDPKLITPLVVSHLVPVIGGLYEYLNFRDSNPQMSKIFLYSTFGVPIVTLIDQMLLAVDFGGYWVSMSGLFLVALIIRKLVLADNKYGDIIWISYTGIFGFIYAYYFSYADDQGIRYLIYHFTLRTIAYSIMIGLLLGVLLIFSSGVLTSPIAV